MAQLLTTRQVCERLDLHPSSVSRLVKTGQLTPAAKLPGLRGPMLFDPADIDAFAEARA